MQGHMAVAISMAMAAGLALTGCGSTGTTGVSAETSAGGKNEAGRNTAGNTAGGQEESQSGAGAAQVTDTKKGGKIAFFRNLMMGENHDPTTANRTSRPNKYRTS